MHAQPAVATGAQGFSHAHSGPLLVDQGHIVSNRPDSVNRETDLTARLQVECSVYRSHLFVLFGWNRPFIGLRVEKCNNNKLNRWVYAIILCR